MYTFLVTGCAGFIGSNLVDRFLINGHNVIGIDNFSTGRKNFLKSAISNSKFRLIEEDLQEGVKLEKYFKGVDAVFHLAANSDVRYGFDQPKKDLEQNIIVTSNVLEATRKCKVKKFFFSSTGSVYGEAKQIPTPEYSTFPVQTSLYAASKLACEGLISSYSYGYGIQVWIFRFVSIFGERYTHGHIYDFYKSLKHNSQELRVLGDGSQAKSYLYIHDCIDAILVASEFMKDKINIVNLGVNDTCKLSESISWISEEMGVEPNLIYSGGKQGWIGDNPLIYLDTTLIKSFGWSPKLSIKEGVVKTVRYLDQNQWLFK